MKSDDTMALTTKKISSANIAASVVVRARRHCTTNAVTSRTTNAAAVNAPASDDTSNSRLCGNCA